VETDTLFGKLVDSLFVPEGTLLIVPKRNPPESLEQWLTRCVVIKNIGPGVSDKVRDILEPKQHPETVSE
jgi:hypothetical protein